MSWKDFGDWAFFGAAIASLLFVLVYLTIAPWWETSTGRNIMAVMGTVAIAFGYFAWVILAGGVPDGFYPVRALLFTGIALSISWRVWMLIRVQLRRKPKEGNRNEPQDAR